MGGDINIGIKEYLMYDGFSFRFVPIRNKTSSREIGFADPEELYNKMMNVYKWDALKRGDYYVDYQNYYTFCGVLSQRNLFVNAAKEMLKVGDRQKAVELLDKCQECVPAEDYPLDMTYLGFSNEYMVVDMIETYYEAGARDKALALAEKFADEMFGSTVFFLEFYEFARPEFESCYKILQYLSDLCEHFGDKELATKIRDNFNQLVEAYE
jgi:tetratricopeptide (TPR) repeat protein